MSFSTSDTIVAIATPPGRGALGIVRLSGPAALDIGTALVGRATPLAPRHATFATLSIPSPGEHDSSLSDHVVATSFPGPHSYTGEDVVEISAHGAPVVLHAIVAASVSRGARLAAPGEFTLRAFLNGRIDLPQAEAVADLIEAATPLQVRTAFDQLNGTLTSAIGAIDQQLFDLIARLEASVDFPDEGYHFVDAGALASSIGGIVARLDRLLADARTGRLVREGLRVAIVGAPNVGKSSLFNALVGSARAIVTAIPGTTRDMVSEVIDLNGLRVTLVDTAGVRDTSDIVEAEGVSRSTAAARTADLAVVVADGSQGEALAPAVELLQTIDNKGFIVSSKSDLPAAWTAADAVAVSAMTGLGLPALKQRIVEALDVELHHEAPALTNVRHIALVEQARTSLERARAAASQSGGAMPEEFVLADLQDARTRFDEICGKRTTDDILVHIFSRFCIGK